MRRCVGSGGWGRLGVDDDLLDREAEVGHRVAVVLVLLIHLVTSI